MYRLVRSTMGSRVRAGADIVAAAIVDHDARLIRQDQLAHAIQHVLRNGAGDGPVDHWQRSHLLGEVRPELENTAARKHDAAMLRRSGLAAGTGFLGATPAWENRRQGKSGECDGHRRART